MGGVDSKAKFAEQLSTLQKEPINAKDDNLWKNLFTTPVQFQDVTDLLSQADIRKLRTTQPYNLGTTIFKCVEQLYLFSLPKNFWVEFTSAKNSLYLLTRIIPVLFEHDEDDFTENLFFQNKIKKSDGSEETITTIGKDQLGFSVAESLITTLMNLFFVPEYTIPMKQFPVTYAEKELERHQSKVFSNLVRPSLLWEGGVCAPKGSRWFTADQMNNRMDVMRCFMVCLSKQLYSSPTQAANAEQNKFLTIAISGKVPHIPNLLFSLINTIFSYDASTVLPYTSQLLADSSKEGYISSCIQLLTILLDNTLTTTTAAPTPKIEEEEQQQAQEEEKLDGEEKAPEEEKAPTISEEEKKRGEDMRKRLALKGKKYEDATIVITKNMYTACLNVIQVQQDFDFIVNGLTELLQNVVIANNTVLPYSQKMISFHEELIVLFFKILEQQKSFANYLCGSGKIVTILVPLCYIVQESLKSSSTAILQISTFLLLYLSGIREFGVALNQPFNEKMILDLPSFQSGNYADFLILFLYKIKTSKSKVAKAFFDSYLTIVCNISPYLKKLSLNTSVKMVKLFQAFSAPVYLYSSPKKYQSVCLMLETFNNLIQYQYDGSVNLVYSILRHKDAFDILKQEPNVESLTQEILKKSTQKKPKEGEKEEKQFIPTKEWLKSIRSQFPLETIDKLLEILNPAVIKLCTENMSTQDEVIRFLQNTTLVGLLPVPHSIILRPLKSNLDIEVYLQSFIWGSFYAKNTQLFSQKAIKLFKI